MEIVVHSKNSLLQ